MLAQLGFEETLWSSFFESLFSAAFTGLLVVGAAGLVVRWYESRLTKRQFDEQNRAAALRQAADIAQEDRLQARQLEHESRADLRLTYGLLLVVQRESREASLRLAMAGGDAADPHLARLATDAHDEFTVQYHRLNLGASPEMWLDARALRHVLDDMHDLAHEGRGTECAGLAEVARHARQNLEQSFRARLGLKPLRDPSPLGKYDKRGK